ncbi:hypothetical protein [Actinomadura sp. CNU-125]|uniref:hypothetical protein n=1 Tax=Actinomadura sp. CNU-125 TaxID=1904961 RepID=UPI001177990B|nr:hypothetical protein [Actinomadura sp. CNU-125]
MRRAFRRELPAPDPLLSVITASDRAAYLDVRGKRLAGAILTDQEQARLTCADRKFQQSGDGVLVSSGARIEAPGTSWTPGAVAASRVVSRAAAM